MLKDRKIFLRSWETDELVNHDSSGLLQFHNCWKKLTWSILVCFLALISVSSEINEISYMWKTLSFSLNKTFAGFWVLLFFFLILSLDRIIIISVMYYPQIHIQYVDFYGGGIIGVVFVFHTISLINGCIFAIFIYVYTQCKNTISWPKCYS